MLKLYNYLIKPNKTLFTIVLRTIRYYHNIVSTLRGDLMEINLNDPNIMDAGDASQIWGHAKNYVRRTYKSNPSKFPQGSIRKFGKQWIVTTKGMEAITGVKDPRRKDIKFDERN